MVNIDIVGEFHVEPDEKLEKAGVELFLIDRITSADEFQEVLIIYPPPKKRLPLRWKAYTAEEADVLYDYVEKGGILVLIPPSNPTLLEKLSGIFERFAISPVFCKENLLLHVNAHLINYGKEGKRPIKQYFHFLMEDKESSEVVIEGNWIPIFAFKFIGKGLVLLYGLGSQNFWKEDLSALFKYLLQDYAYFWENSELTEKQLENILHFTRKEQHEKIRDEFIRAFVQKKKFPDFLEIRDPALKEDLIQNIQLSTMEKEFKDLSGKYLARKYRELHKLLNKEYPTLINKIQKFIYRKVLDKTITAETFNSLYESDLLQPEAAYLLIVYLDPKDPENYKKFKDNLTKLIQWNKKEEIIEEDFLKNLAWEHL